MEPMNGVLAKDEEREDDEPFKASHPISPHWQTTGSTPDLVDFTTVRVVVV